MLGTNQFTTTISRLDQIYIKKKEKEQILTPALRPGRRPEIYVDSYAGDALFLPTLKKKQTNILSSSQNLGEGVCWEPGLSLGFPQQSSQMNKHRPTCKL